MDTNQKYSIDKNVEMPRPDRVTYPWTNMEVGDSFLVKCDKINNRNISSTISNSGSSWGKIHGGKKFATRIVEGGVRVWRTK